MLVLSDDDSDIDNDPISDESDSGDDIPKVLQFRLDPLKFGHLLTQTRI